MLEDKEQIYILDTRSLPVRIGLVILIILALAFAWFSVRWQFGNLLADETSPNEPGADKISEIAKSFAPNDPLTNWLAASVKKETNFEYTEGFEDVVKLAPNDYRWWIQLGRANEQAGKTSEAEKALKRAVELAPNYTFPHWQIGNFYLRQDRADEAFTEMKKASANNTVYRDQVFSIAWDYYENDSEKLESIAGNSPEIRASLAKFYATKEYPEKSLRMWNTLDPQQKRQNEQIARLIAQSLYDKKFLLTAVEFLNQLGIEKGARAESVYNGGFEQNISDSKFIYFGWNEVPTERIKVQYSSTRKKEGKRSLQVTFTGFDKLEVNNIYQTIAVKPSTKYRLGFWLKTENLKSAGLPRLDILSTKDHQIIATSEPFPGGTNDWQEIKIDFTVPAETEGVYIRTSRNYCGEKCPIFGTFWLDDFKLTKLSGE